MKIIRLTFLFLILFTSQVLSHVGHYSKLKSLKFELLRNNVVVGSHIIVFNYNNNILEVYNEIRFKIKKLGITFYNYSSDGVEKYNQNGELIYFKSNTLDNKKQKFCQIKLNKNKYVLNGSAYKGNVDKDFVISSYWNHEILKKTLQVSAITCRLIEQKVNFVAREDLVVRNKNFKAAKFNINGKNLNTTVWYDIDSKMILKQILTKKGKWKYKMISYENYK